MTAYSVMTISKGHAILATWAAAPADRTIKITTVDNDDTAHGLAWELSRLSENAWQAVMWLDCAAAVEAWIVELVAWLRAEPDPAAGRRRDRPPCPVPASTSRHAEADPFAELVYQADFDLPYSLNELTQAQRRTVADEIVVDARERAETLRSLRAGVEPADESRAWQAFGVGRVTGAGRRGRLLDAAPAWLLQNWASSDLPLSRWGVRSQLLRLDQLAAAAVAAGGAGAVDDDPVEASGRLPHAVDDDGPMGESWKVWPGGRSRWQLASHAPMTVYRDHKVVGEVPADDDAGFVKLLGEWAAGAGGSWWTRRFTVAL